MEGTEVKNRFKTMVAVILLAAVLSLSGCGDRQIQTAADQSSQVSYEQLSDIPEFYGEPYVTLSGNAPDFSREDMAADSFENYSQLDSLGRCGQAYAMISTETMPTEKRGSIGQIKPSGWHTVRYDYLISDKYLYNRCHLIGFQLAGENANEKNLITGTRYMNVEGMLPFEDEVADYVKETGNRVLYRVTPVYEGDDLVARGVVMEAYSVEDSGEGVSFNVFVYNVQPGIVIDYATGDSQRADTSMPVDDDKPALEQSDQLYVLNNSTKKFHLPECASADKIKSENREETKTSRKSLMSMGYEPCGNCNP